MTSVDPVQDWLVILTGPVCSTYVRMPLTATEVAVLRRLGEAVSEVAVSGTRPGLRITPWSQASATQRAFLAHQQHQTTV
ncbi:hypothetical protein OHB26_39345 (plasmid) [Nocardia sp. NBC_01503]|uniref:hypothetical protein n=1 Tax=Nocardia sp. NBC_01503 TaxID=2975997 RepID=UPI002E7C32C8|nr:hypothetical protein [Nocardia sp. NBC_01503]WTL36712.1 hypothetical protein OHB26_39230 [Nocardia sp. NBC_01503]WTL36735.1 hypothetical protein OHB26_39345 [Nocardia sp. NBC_01503]